MDRRAFRVAYVHRFGSHCGYCGNDVQVLTIDHIVPLSNGGPDQSGNWCLACSACNNMKRNSSLHKFRYRLKRKKRITALWIETIGVQLSIAPNVDWSNEGVTRNV